jgi:hypothetical protein
MSLTEPMPSQRGHMPPLTVKLRAASRPLAAALLDGDLRRAADRRDVERERVGRADVGLPERLNSTRSIALASVAVPTVERALAPIRSWSTMIAVVSPRARRRRAAPSVGMKPCTNAL